MTEMVTVRLVLYGLMAFVPNSNDSPLKIDALLVDARGLQHASDGCKIPPHIPAVYANAGRCRVNGRPCAVSDQVESPTDPISGAWRLDRESLNIEVLPAGDATRVQELSIVHGRVNAAMPSNPEQSTSLGWIPEMRALIAPGIPDRKSGVDKDCLGKATDCPIVARVALDAGRITSCHLAATQPDGLVYPFEFKPLDSALQPVIVQAMSDAVLVSFRVPRGSKVQIVSRSFDADVGSQPRRTIVLEDEGRETIDVWIANVPSYYEPVMEHSSCHDMSMDIDRHFELYYNLLAERVPFSKRFVPQRLKANDQVRRGSTVQPKDSDYCPMLAFYEGEDFQVASGEPDKVPNDWKSCGNIWLSAPQP